MAERVLEREAEGLSRPVSGKLLVYFIALFIKYL